jgi:crotonobetainyl-CoA:carnitine CoA-transferase CaiB-like acyl-CoA transferase
VARTGAGCFVDFSQRELTVSLLGEAMMDYALNGRVQGPLGNRHPQYAPQGVYPCSGEDAWIALTIESGEQWRRLREAMGDPEWVRDPALETASGRQGRHDEIDAALAAWTVEFDKFALMQLLQGHGIPAGAVLTGLELLDDAQLGARGWWERVVPTEVGRPFQFVTAPWRLSASPWRPSTPAPCLGEHNDRVFLDLLGLAPAEYAQLQREGVISTEPLWVRV